jgi:hypothetical protein
MLCGSSKFVKVLRSEDRAVAEVGKKVGTVLTKSNTVLVCEKRV